MFYRYLYRPIMRLAHRFNWHYAPPIYPDGDKMLWCKWCGMRDVVERKGQPKIGTNKEQSCMNSTTQTEN